MMGREILTTAWWFKEEFLEEKLPILKTQSPLARKKKACVHEVTGWRKRWVTVAEKIEHL